MRLYFGPLALPVSSFHALILAALVLLRAQPGKPLYAGAAARFKTSAPIQGTDVARFRISAIEDDAGPPDEQNPPGTPLFTVNGPTWPGAHPKLSPEAVPIISRRVLSGPTASGGGAHGTPEQGLPACYVTGVFGGNIEYELWGVRVLADSLAKVGAAAPLVVMVPDDEDEAQFGVVNQVENVRLLRSEMWDRQMVYEAMLGHNPRHAYSFHKLQVFSDIPETMCRDMMIWIDTDVMVIRNPDYLFVKHKDMANGVVSATDYDGPRTDRRDTCGSIHMINAGVFVFRRDEIFAAWIKDALLSRSYNGEGDGQVIEHYYRDWDKLDPNTAPFPHSCRCENLQEPFEWTMVHFTWEAKKPLDLWMEERRSNRHKHAEPRENFCGVDAPCGCAAQIYQNWFELASRAWEKTSIDNQQRLIEFFRAQKEMLSRNAIAEERRKRVAEEREFNLTHPFEAAPTVW